MSNDFKSQVMGFLGQFFGQKNIITVPVALVDATGSLEAALFLSQLLYWSDRGTLPDGWIAKTYAEWYEEIRVSEYEIRKATKSLTQAGVETKVAKWNGAPTVHYRINRDQFLEWLSGSFQNGKSKIQGSKVKNSRIETERFQELYTETTSETTSENQDIAYAPQAGADEAPDLSPLQRVSPSLEEAFEGEETAAPLIPDLVYEDLGKPRKTKKSTKTVSKSKKPDYASKKEVMEPRKATAINSIISAYIKSTGTVMANPYGDTALRAVARALDDAGITGDDVSTYVAEKIATDPFWIGKLVTLKYIAGGIVRWKEQRTPIAKQSKQDDFVPVPLDNDTAAELEDLLAY